MKSTKVQKKIRRHNRVRAKIIGIKEIPRVSVFRSNRHLFVQFIDDKEGKTILSSVVKLAKKTTMKGTKTEKAEAIGEILAKKAIEAGIKKIVFDRGGNKFHGRVKALADSLRKNGLTF